MKGDRSHKMKFMLLYLFWLTLHGRAELWWNYLDNSPGLRPFLCQRTRYTHSLAYILHRNTHVSALVVVSFSLSFILFSNTAARPSRITLRLPWLNNLLCILRGTSSQANRRTFLALFLSLSLSLSLCYTYSRFICVSTWFSPRLFLLTPFSVVHLERRCISVTTVVFLHLLWNTEDVVESFILSS